MNLLYFEHIESSSEILSVLMIGFVGICTTYIFGTLLTSNGNLKNLNIMAACGMIVNITLNLILIPKFEVLGSAIASMITQVLTGISQALIAKYVFKFKLNYKTLLSLLIFIVFSILITFVLSTQNYNWFFAVGLSAAISFILAFATGLFKIKTIFTIINETSRK